MNRKPRTVLSMVLPSMKSVLQKANDDMSAKKRMKAREFTVGGLDGSSLGIMEEDRSGFQVRSKKLQVLCLTKCRSKEES